MTEISELSNLLRTRKLRATSTRLEVLSVFSNFKKAIPYSELQAQLSDFDRVTLYRTIHALMDHGIIHKAIVTENETYYAMCSHHCDSHHHQHKHIHFKCTVCNAVSCVESEGSVALDIPGYIVHEVAVEVSGICPDCA